MPTRRRLTRHPDLPLTQREEIGAFSLDGRSIPFCEADTVASAACAAGVTVFSRSFKYHRPRGLYDNHGFGSEVLVTIDGTPNVPADRALARDGLRVRTQNAWPSVNFDCLAASGALLQLLPNGFYYKMFHKPRWAWPLFEKGLRHAAGLGRIDTDGRDQEQRYDKRYRFPDVCVIGGGPAGMAAALAASGERRRVLLIERSPALGGHSICNISRVRECPDAACNGLPEHDAVRRLTAAVTGDPGIEVLTGTAAFGIYEDNYVAAENGRELYKIRAAAIVVACGANDRHLVFQNNDVPGIMTARAVERLIGLHGVVPGRRAVVITSHDGGSQTAKILHGAGVKVAAVVDSRPERDSGEFTSEIRELGIPIIADSTIRSASGWKRVRRVLITSGASDGPRSLRCDLVVMAVGYTPLLGLLSAAGGRAAWDPGRQVFRVSDLPRGLYAAGEVNGPATFGRLYREGWDVGAAAARNAPAPQSERDSSECIPAPPPFITRSRRGSIRSSSSSASRAWGWGPVRARPATRPRPGSPHWTAPSPTPPASRRP
jgi:sarcosine oxidase subunit alpha